MKKLSEEEILLMKKACSIVGNTLTLLRDSIKVGITTLELDDIAREFIISQGATPSFLNYDGFPASICASVNSVVVHGIPSSYALQDGDIIGIDVGACYKGYHGDAARTFIVGQPSNKICKLVEETKRCFFKGIEGLKPGDRIGKISNAIQENALKHNYGIVKELVGHGIGRHLHEDPNIPNYGSKDSGPEIVENCTLAIEPMINLGTSHIKLLSDGWTVVTSDGKPSAHYENTVLVTKNGVEILTLMKGENTL